MAESSSTGAQPDPASVVIGVDVSHFQGPIDWAKVSADGVAFAFAKATDGLGADPTFATNWNGANAAGIFRGAYHFFRPKLPAIDQAKHFCDTVGSLGPGDLPPVLDVESIPLRLGPGDDWDSLLTADARQKVVMDWLAFVSDALQKTPILYTNRSFWQPKFGVPSTFATFPLWIAAYATAPSLPGTWQRWTFWQHTDHGQVSGIKGDVDMDRFNGSLSELEQFTGEQAAAQPATIS